MQIYKSLSVVVLAWTVVISLAIVVYSTESYGHHAQEHRKFVIGERFSIDTTLICDTEKQVRTILDAQKHKGVSGSIEIFEKQFEMALALGVEPPCLFVPVLNVWVLSLIVTYHNMDEGDGNIATYYVVRILTTKGSTYFTITTWPPDQKQGTPS